MITPTFTIFVSLEGTRSINKKTEKKDYQLYKHLHTHFKVFAIGLTIAMSRWERTMGVTQVPNIEIINILQNLN